MLQISIIYPLEIDTYCNCQQSLDINFIKRLTLNRPKSNLIKLFQAPPPQENNFSQNPNTTPGYSLFNANSWTPNLAGQLRNSVQTENSANHMQQQSLFSGHGPKSLAQLLEQQSQLNQKNLQLLTSFSFLIFFTKQKNVINNLNFYLLGLYYC